MSAVSFQDLPDEVIIHALLFLPREDLFSSCILVCSRFEYLLDSVPFWTQMCDRVVNASPLVSPETLRSFWFQSANESWRDTYFMLPGLDSQLFIEFAPDEFENFVVLKPLRRNRFTQSFIVTWPPTGPHKRYLLKRIDPTVAARRKTLWMYRREQTRLPPESRVFSSSNLSIAPSPNLSHVTNLTTDTQSTPASPLPPDDVPSPETDCEREVAERLHSTPLVSRLLWSWEEDSQMYLVHEYCGGGSLRETATRFGDNEWFDSATIRFILVQVILFLKILRIGSVSHRRISPESIFFSNSNEDKQQEQHQHIKISDFRWMHNPGSVSSDLSLDHRDDLLQSAVFYLIKKSRTKDLVFIPPEFFDPSQEDSSWHACAWDLWCVGALAYWLFSRGEFPFVDSSSEDLVEVSAYVLLDRMLFPERFIRWDFGDDDSGFRMVMGREEKSLVEQLMVVSAKERLGFGDLDDIFKHAYFIGIDIEKIKESLLWDERNANPPDQW